MRIEPTNSYKAGNTRKTTAWVVLALYLAFLCWILLLKMHVTDFGDLAGRRSLNLVPFGASGEMGGLGSREILLNVLAFVPLGMLVYLVAARRGVWLWVPLIGTAVAFEVTQFVFGIGASDITDVITNTAGGLLGLGAGWLGVRLLGARAVRWIPIGLCVLLALFIGGFYTWMLATGVRFRL
ncbi:VanZ family protein [Leucobacter denitrificans]|uniref:VanZ family protein n=1 Tax=Leucobacter denitrificans TaxID=683042 RepID=A0A7G9S5C7_9MICO|nr:VanZ family protein [Leucobacter denitrificans]QNN63052.1 VanZ family protein [Leucobacter denitrificans]